MCFAPERAYEDPEGKNRIFDEMWTGDEYDDPDSPDQFGGLGYSVAKAPAYPQTCVSSLVNDFGAANFLPHLHTFLQNL